MFALESYAVVRRFVFVEGHSRREAAKVFGLSRDTVAKMCAFSLPPGYRRAKPPEKPKLGPLLPVIDAMLREDRLSPARQQHTAKRIFERLRDEHGYGGGYTVVKDFLNGTQSHLDYLPEGHTDFVFATMAEEWGLVGGCLLILAFLLVIRWGVEVGQRAKTRFARLTAAGLATTIFFYVAINLMMVMGLAPVVGIPLPLVSFGSSAQMTVLLCLGILMSIDRENRREARW